MPELRMPSLGADMEHGKVVEWLVKPGDYVHRGDLVAAVDTEKTVMEIESFEEGVVAEYLVDLGETVPVGTPIARVTGTPADVPPPAPTDAAGRALAPELPTPPEPATRPAEVHADAHPDGGRVTPPIRHLAHQLGVDVEGITGTGRHGAVTRSDVEAAASAVAPRPEEPAALSGRAARGGGRVRSSPRARRLADELDVDLTAVRGTGPDGAVTEADVRGAAAAPVGRTGPAEAEPTVRAAGGTETAALAEPAGPATPAPERRSARAAAAERVASLRRAIGALMARSKREVPHYYLSTTIDLGRALDWMREVNAGRPISERLVPAALLLAATARAAREVPDVNGLYVDDAFRPSTAVHLGVAVALRGGGLVAPAIRDADSMPLDELMAALRDLVARARAGRLQRAEMTDPTITVTNLGDLGVEAVFGVIYAPQVALVGFGRVTEQPWARDGMIGVHPVVTASLSADHRVSDGLRGGRFLSRIDELLQNPEGL
ncbi:MAG TPA: 2-oxo acid dehydrogenase subunit E2 [Agromyces sp.]